MKHETSGSGSMKQRASGSGSMKQGSSPWEPPRINTDYGRERSGNSTYNSDSGKHSAYKYQRQDTGNDIKSELNQTFKKGGTIKSGGKRSESRTPTPATPQSPTVTLFIQDRSTPAPTSPFEIERSVRTEMRTKSSDFLRRVIYRKYSIIQYCDLWLHPKEKLVYVLVNYLVLI
jgi:hypothetical protein